MRLAKCIKSLCGVTRNKFYEIKVEGRFVGVYETNSIPSKRIDTMIPIENMNEYFEYIQTIDEAIEIIKDKLSLNEQIFKCDFNEISIWQIKYNGDLITLKPDKYTNQNYPTSFFIEIKSENKTHRLAFTILLVKNNIENFCEFIKFLYEDD